MKRTLSLILCVVTLYSFLPIGILADVIPDISESAIVSNDGTTTTYNVDLLDESQQPIPDTSTQMSSSLSRSGMISSSAEESGVLDENAIVPVNIGTSIQAESSELVDESILTTEFQEKAELQESLEANPQMTLLSAGENTAYNSVIAPTAKNLIKQPEFAMNGTFSEYVSPYSGEMSMQATDLNLTGRNGLNLSISRLYQTNQSDYGEKILKVIDGVRLHTYTNSTYDQDRYALGAGWSFGYPSVEVRNEDDIQALYYHTGTGNVFKVNFDDPSVYGNLENLTTANLIFNYCNSTYTYNNGQEASVYYAKTIDGTCQYFANDGRLLGIKDRFGNYLNFKHTNMAVSNILLNPTFITPDATSADVWTRSTTKNSYSSDTMRYTSTTKATSNATSAYVEVDAEKNYIFNGWYKLLGTSLNAYDGTVNIKVRRYDYNKSYLGEISLSSQSYNTTSNQLVNIVQEFSAGYSTKYVQVVLENYYAKGDMFFDNICMDKAKPLITEIADQVGRKLTFNYGDYIYSYSPVNPNVTVTLTSEKDPSITRTFTYIRDNADGTIKSLYNGLYFKQEVDNWVLLGFKESGKLKQQYMYNVTGYSSSDPNSTDPDLREYFSFLYTTINESRDSCVTTKALITDVIINNTKIKYEYEKTTKKLGYTGYYQTQRVKKKYETYAEEANGDKVFTNQTKMNEKTFTYTNDETGYADNNGVHSVSISQTNGLNTSYQYNDNLLTYKNDNDTITGESISQYHLYEDPLFWNMPSQIKTTRTISGESIVSYQFYNYNYWGGIEKETLPMTDYEKANNKAKFTITYDYHCSTTDDSVNYAIPSKKTWYNDLTGALMEETVAFDSLDRPVSVTNAKGEVTSYTYDTIFNWLPATVTQTDINNMHGLAAVSYTQNYQWDSGVYPYKIIENDGTDCEKTYLYNFIYDRIKKITDEDSKVIEYYYDEYGRISEIWYPSIRGYNNFSLKDKFYYEFNENFTVGGRYYYRTVCNTYDYYNLVKSELVCSNDYGQELFKTVAKSGGEKTQTTDYDTYYRPVKQTDFNGNYITLAYDAYNRTVETTDMANNKIKVKYGLNDVETYFKGANLVEENHSLETMDIRGNVISKSIYPNGRASTPITQSSTYNIVGNLKTYTDGKGNTTTFEYDKIGQLIKTKLPGTTDTQYNTTNYGKNGQPTFDRQIDDANSNRTAVLYNSRYLPSLRMDSSNSSTETESYTYDQRGKLSTKTDRKSNTTEYLYDDFGNLKTSTVQTGTVSDTINLYYSPYGGIAKYTYTNHPDLEKIPDRFGNTTATFDERDSLFAQTWYRYDDTNKLKGVNDPYFFDVAYDYNNLNRLTTVTTSDTQNFVYEYYPDGMLKTLTYPTSGIKTEYTYDNVNRVLTVITKKGTEVIASFTYTYDNNSNIETVKDKNNATTTYNYDPQNRLLSVIYPTKTVSYTYDAFGNRKTETIGTTIKNYNYKGNVLSSVGNQNFEYDKNGNLLSDGEITYEYDSRNKLISSTKNDVTTNYTCNAEGLRTDKDNNWYHLNENGQVIAESVIYNDVAYLQAQTVWADKPLARKIDGVYYYYIYNAHNDVVAMTDDTGNIVNSYEYDAWGNVESQVEGISNPIKYAGEYQDPETGLYYLRARYYDPKIGRFTQEDPARDEKNWYAYCDNNPVNNTDPSGCNPFAIAQQLASTPTGQQVLNQINQLATQAGVSVETFIVNNLPLVQQLVDEAGNIIPAVWDWSTNTAVPWLAEKTQQAGKAIGDVANKTGNWIADKWNNATNGDPNKDPNKSGMNNKRILDNVKIKGYKVSLDLEKGGSGENNIHIKVNNTKYVFNDTVQAFIDSDGNRLPSSLRGNQKIIDAFNKAQKLIDKGW